MAAVLLCAFALFSSSPSAYAEQNSKIKNVKSTTKTNSVQTAAVSIKTIIVSPGDNLSDLAATYSTTIARIYDANLNITNPDLIYPGEVLVIPSASQVLADRPLPESSNVDVSTSVATTPSPVASQASVTSATQTTSVSDTESAGSDTASSSDTIWDEIAQCESGGDWSIDTGNGFYGGLQFTLSSWYSVGGIGYPNQASPAEQIAAAERLQSMQGWGAWPVCSAKLGL